MFVYIFFSKKLSKCTKSLFTIFHLLKTIRRLFSRSRCQESPESSIGFCLLFVVEKTSATPCLTFNRGSGIPKWFDVFLRMLGQGLALLSGFFSPKKKGVLLAVPGVLGSLSDTLLYYLATWDVIFWLFWICEAFVHIFLSTASCWSFALAFCCWRFVGVFGQERQADTSSTLRVQVWHQTCACREKPKACDKTDFSLIPYWVAGLIKAWFTCADPALILFRSSTFSSMVWNRLLCQYSRFRLFIQVESSPMYKNCFVMFFNQKWQL